MTTSVKVTACCSADKHVRVTVARTVGTMMPDEIVEQEFLENGQTKEVYIYDTRYVIVKEEVKV